MLETGCKLCSKIKLHPMTISNSIILYRFTSIQTKSIIVANVGLTEKIIIINTLLYFISSFEFKDFVLVYCMN